MEIRDTWVAEGYEYLLYEDDGYPWSSDDIDNTPSSDERAEIARRAYE